MHVAATLQAVVDRLIAELPTRYGVGNCFVNITDIPLAQIGKAYAEVTYGGSAFSHEDGGNLGRTWTLVISMHEICASEEVGKNAQTVKDTLNDALEVVKLFHLWINQTLMAQGMRIKSESPPRSVPGNRGEVVIEQRYEVMSVATFEELTA